MLQANRVSPLLLSALLTSALSTLASAYPINPVPLWELVRDSQFIVVAEVIRVHDPDPPVNEDESPIDRVINYSAKAELEILEIWKGDIGNMATVNYARNLICPVPPRYEEGAIVLAFLGRNNEGLFTVGLSYGTLYPSRSDMRVFRVLVESALKLQSDSPVSDSAYTDWLVEASTSPATRWHGLYPLTPDPPRMLVFSEIAEIDERPEPVLLPIHLELIADAFIADPAVDRNAIRVLELLDQYPSEELDFVAASAVEAALEEEKYFWWVGKLITATILRFGVTPELLESQGLFARSQTSEKQIPQAIWDAARILAPIPDAPPAPVRSSEVQRVVDATEEN
jgi:hypothetical protein